MMPFNFLGEQRERGRKRQEKRQSIEHMYVCVGRRRQQALNNTNRRQKELVTIWPFRSLAECDAEAFTRSQ